jgi:acetyltransferase-like isoleucine patch superfamily enzyme
MLKLGKYSKITSEHVVDCTRSITIGDYSIVAGCRSQFWTHGYLHAPEGLGRFRIDGAIHIGNNVYIGSACVFNAGVRVSDAITVGAASCVARSLDRPGLYVSQPLRYVELDYEQAASRNPEVQVEGLLERVVNKSSPPELK